MVLPYCFSRFLRSRRFFSFARPFANLTSRCSGVSAALRSLSYFLASSSLRARCSCVSTALSARVSCFFRSRSTAFRSSGRAAASSLLRKFITSAFARFSSVDSLSLILCRRSRSFWSRRAFASVLIPALNFWLRARSRTIRLSFSSEVSLARSSLRFRALRAAVISFSSSVRNGHLSRLRARRASASSSVASSRLLCILNLSFAFRSSSSTAARNTSSSASI